MFLSGNTNITVGTGEAFTLNRDELAIQAALKGDGYFGEKGFWKKVLCNFTSEGIVGSGSVSQKKTLVFQEEDISSIQASSTAMVGQWFLKEVIILDADGGFITINRDELPDANLYFVNII
jgi:hypothetical protein